MSQTPKSRSVRATKEGLEKVRQTMAQLEKPRKRDDKGWTQEDLAERSGVSLSTVKRFLNEEPVDKQTIIQITRALGFQPTDIVAPLEWNPPKTPSSVIPWHEVCPPLPLAEPKFPDGPVPLDSAFYVEPSPVESECYRNILQPGSLIRIKAPKQMGKTSLLDRILAQAKKQGYRTVRLNLLIAEEAVLANLDKFLRWFCARVSGQLQLQLRLDDYWDEEQNGSMVSCTTYFEAYLLEQGGPLVLGLDEVDQLFQYPDIARYFFPLLRTWHEEANNLDIWRKLRLVVVHSTEDYPNLDINQSPFNVGLPVELREWSQQQVQDIAKRHGLDWAAGLEAERLMDMVGGHPYLVRIALYYIRYRGITLDWLLQTAPTEGEIYSAHLRCYLETLKQHPELAAAMKKVVDATSPVRLEPTQAYKLHSMGLVKRHKNGGVTPRCELYRQYFREYLEFT